jgi:Fe-S cluster biogenesis protein NfuA
MSDIESIVGVGTGRFAPYNLRVASGFSATPASGGSPEARFMSHQPATPSTDSAVTTSVDANTPAAVTPPVQSIYQRVAHVLNRIRPAVQSDGGDLELVEITPDNIVRIRMHGACVGCPSSSITLKVGIERNVREKVPEVVAVEQVP